MSSSDAIVDTLRGRILRGLKAGTLTTGARLPSTRELQDEFGLDHRPILAAYRVLANEGIVEIRERGGVYVAQPRGGSDRLRLSATWVADIFADAYRRGIPLGELGSVLRRSTETLRLRVVVLSANEELASRIVRELIADFGLLAEWVLLASAHPDSPVTSTLRRADFLIAPMAHSDDAAVIAARLRKPWFAVDLRPEFVVGEWTLLLRRELWAIVGSAEFGALLMHAFAHVKDANNLRVLVYGRDDLSVIPAGAPVYVTHRVREAIAETEVNGAVLPPDRTIAPESMRPIIDFVVHANTQALEALWSAARQRGAESRGSGA